MKLYALILFVTITSHTALQAQESQTLYVGKKGGYVNSLDSAAFIRILKAPDSGSTLFGVFEYSNDGKIMSMGYCKDPRQILYEGQYISYYPNGKKRNMGFYINGIINKTEYLFYPNGQLYLARLFKYKKNNSNFSDKKEASIQTLRDSLGNVLLTDGTGYYIQYNDDFTKVEVEGNYVNSKWHGEVKGIDHITKTNYIDTYHHGKLISGVATDTIGKQYSYNELYVAGGFEPGPKSFENLIWKKISPIVGAKRLKGKMVVGFNIDHLGHIQSAKVNNSLDPEIDKEILLLLNSGIVFKPSLFRGMPIKMRYGLPIVVDFNNPAQNPFTDPQNPKSRMLPL